MQVVTLTIKEAEEFLKQHERHYKMPVEPVCAVGVGENIDVTRIHDSTERATANLRGAAIIGRRDWRTAELAHIYCDGTSQGYTLLYGACWRIIKALGYELTAL